MGNNLERTSSPKPYQNVLGRSSPTRGDKNSTQSRPNPTIPYSLSSSLPLPPASAPADGLSPSLLSSGSYSSPFQHSPVPSRREGSIMLEPLPTSAPSSAPSSFQSHSPFTDLPTNVLSRIFSLLSAIDLLRCALVSKEWMVLASMDEWWEKLAMNDLQKSCLLSEMLHEREQLPQLIHGSWRELYWKYHRKEALTYHPLVVAIYDYRARTQREIDLRRGEVLHLIAKDDESCWWFVQRRERPVGGVEHEGQRANAKERRVEEELEKPSGVLEREDQGENQTEVGEGEQKAEANSDTNELSGQSFSDKAEETEAERIGSSDERTKEEKIKGWVPSGYLDYCTHKALSNKQNTDSTIPSMVRAKLDFVAANAKELGFKKYDLMSIDQHPKKQYHATESGDEQDADSNPRTSKARWFKATLTRRNSSGGTVTLSGWIPANLVTDDVRHMIALFDYAPACEEELSLKKGQRVALLGADEGRKGWLYAQANGRRGWLPENYLVWDNGT